MTAAANPIPRGVAGRPRDVPGPKTSERIFQTAVRLFYAKGYEATTVRAISDACGLTPGAIYNHYRSKDEILYAIIRWSHDELDRDIEEALRAADDAPAARLYAAIHTFVLRHTRFREAARVTNRDYGSLEPERLAETIGRRRQTRAVFQTLIEAANPHLLSVRRIQDHNSRAISEIMAMAVINMMVMVAEWYHEGGTFTAEQVADLHADLVIAMVGNHV
jgi:AcrR family transcriptional regulator